MHNEQVFTPEHVVDTMFEELEYNGNNVRNKHIIDNSCGNGAILKKVVRTYINVCIMCGLSKKETVNELETYIHGIEIDGSLVKETVETLDKIAEEYSLGNVNWDVMCSDSLFVREYDNRMDYVIGNPPYCNIHDIPKFKRDFVKQYQFANGGMTDMFLVFFEIGIKMLKDDGKLIYITPNSWLTSTAGTNFRKYLKRNNVLLSIYQYGHYRVFSNANTYTCITLISKKPKEDDLFICHRNVSDESLHFVMTYESLKKCMVDDKIYLADENVLRTLRNINNKCQEKGKKRIRAKNGFATLNDKFFIVDDFVKENGLCENIISVYKASNGEKHYFFYPYDKDGKPISSYSSIKDEKLSNYLINKARNMDIDTESNTWYYYGRTQAINDVKYDKLCFNNLIRKREDLKIQFLSNDDENQQGVYSGYYIPIYNEENYKEIMNIISSNIMNEFVEYVKAIGKYKNGGYYTFSSKELENWLNYVCDYYL